MKLEWDPTKRASNLRKHGIDFEDAAAVFDGAYVETPDEREEHGEQRWIVLGEAGQRVIVLVYAWRDEHRRIISARKATSSEAALYYAEIYG